MLTAWLPYLTILVSGFLHTFNVKKLYKPFLILGAILIILLAAGREYGSVSDLENYQLYYAITSLDDIGHTGLEIGYCFLMAVVKDIFSGDFYVFLFIVNSLTFLAVCRVTYKYSVNYALSLLIYFSFYFFLYEGGALRQGLAMFFTVSSFVFIIQKKAVWFYAYVVIAFTCHASAVLFLPAYWAAWHLQAKPKTAAWIVVALVPLVFVDLMPYIGRFFTFFSQADKYADLYTGTGGHVERVGLTLGVVLKVVFFVIYAFSYDKNNAIQSVLFRLYWFYLLLYMPLSSVAIISSRGLDYYKIFDMITLTYAVKNQRTRGNKVAVAALILAYTAYSLFETTVALKRFPSVLQDMLNVIS